MPNAPPGDVAGTCIDPHAALMSGHDHEGMSERTRHPHADSTGDAGEKKSKQIGKMMTPYLAQHIPQQYNPQGLDAPDSTADTKYCYRHRPDLLCRRQADEPSMQELQDVRFAPLALPVCRPLTDSGTAERVASRPAEHRQRLVALLRRPLTAPQPHAAGHPRPVLFPSALVHLLERPQPH
jgi:hypothetical protein